MYPFPIVFCPYKYKNQRKSDEAVDGSLAPLKFIPAWFVTSKMIEKIHTTLYVYDGLHFFDEDSGNVTFC